MTQIEMIYKCNLTIGFRMKGHAGFNKNGPDILCSSLSTASIMTINGIIDWVGIDIDEVLKDDAKEGFIHFEIPYQNTSPTTQQLFKSFEMFVEQLTEQYKDYVSLERRKKDDYENT